MRSNRSLILPLFMKEQPLRIFAILMNMMRDTARFSARPHAMLDAQRDNFLPTGGRNSEGCGDDDHNFSVARVVLFDI